MQQNGKYKKLVFYLEVLSILYSPANQVQCLPNFPTTPESTVFRLPTLPNLHGDATAHLTMLLEENTSNHVSEICSQWTSLKIPKRVTSTRLSAISLKLLKDWHPRATWCSGEIWASMKIKLEIMLEEKNGPTIIWGSSDPSAESEPKRPKKVLWIAEPWNFNPSPLSMLWNIQLKPSQKWLQKSNPWKLTTPSSNTSHKLWKSTEPTMPTTSTSNAWRPQSTPLRPNTKDSVTTVLDTSNILLTPVRPLKLTLFCQLLEFDSYQIIIYPLFDMLWMIILM